MVHFTFVYNISHAHRRVPAEESEWCRLECQIQGAAAATFRESLEDKKRKDPEGKGQSWGALDVPFSSRQLQEEVWLTHRRNF